MKAEYYCYTVRGSLFHFSTTNKTHAVPPFYLADLIIGRNISNKVTFNYIRHKNKSGGSEIF